MRPLPILALALLCSGLTAGCLEDTGPTETTYSVAIKTCFRGLVSGNEWKYAVFGCPEQIANATLRGGGSVRFDVPYNSSGLALVARPSLTQSLGVATLHLETAHGNGSVDYFGPQVNDGRSQGMEALLDGEERPEDSFILSVCGVEEAVVRLEGPPTVQDFKVYLFIYPTSDVDALIEAGPDSKYHGCTNYWDVHPTTEPDIP